METTKIEMSQEKAREKLQAVRRQLHVRADDEYKALEKGYAALAHGTPLIDLEATMRDCAVDDFGRPRLAVARADRKQVYVEWNRNSEWCSFHCAKDFRLDGRWPDLTRSFQMGRENGQSRVTGWSDGKEINVSTEGYAIVPMVPPDVRPARALRRCFVLWEVEEWSDSRLGAQADRDPYLLEHLGGSLYCVIAEWDLTELERAVMNGRLE